MKVGSRPDGDFAWGVALVQLEVAVDPDLLDAHLPRDEGLPRIPTTINI